MEDIINSLDFVIGIAGFTRLVLVGIQKAVRSHQANERTVGLRVEISGKNPRFAGFVNKYFFLEQFFNLPITRMRGVCITAYVPLHMRIGNIEMTGFPLKAGDKRQVTGMSWTHPI